MSSLSTTLSWVLVSSLISSLPSPIEPIIPSTVPTEVETPSPLVVNIDYNYYPVNGSTVADIRSYVRQYGPRNEVEDHHYYANTDWHVQWSYDYAMTDQGCKITNLNGTVNILFTMPLWDAPADASPSLVSDWQQFIDALQIHENGHMDHGVDAATAVLETISQLPTAPTCEEFITTARTEARRVIRSYNQQDIEYDRHTHHGLTQGAVFPPMQPSALQETTSGMRE